MPDPISAAEPASRRGHERVLLVVVTVCALLGYAWAVRDTRREHDRHALMRRFREIEAGLRADTPVRRLLEDGGAQPEPVDPEEEARQRKVARDLERLVRLGPLSMEPVRIESEAEEARVIYRLVRENAASRHVRAPTGGEMRFRREPGGWRLVDHRFLGNPAQVEEAGSSRREPDGSGGGGS